MNLTRNRNIKLVVLVMIIAGTGSGCQSEDIESRFDRSKLGKDFSFESCCIVDKSTEEILFRFAENELRKLENEIGKVEWVDLPDDTIEGMNSLKLCKAEFNYNDKFVTSQSVLVGKAGEQWLLEIRLPDTSGFQGIVSKVTRLDKILETDRIKVLGNAINCDSQN